MRSKRKKGPVHSTARRAEGAGRETELFQRKLSWLNEEMGGASRLADVVNVHRSRVTRWAHGEPPDLQNAAKIHALEFVLRRLLMVFEESTAHKWLFGSNALLGNRRPIDLLEENKVTEVLSAIEQTEAGSYA